MSIPNCRESWEGGRESHLLSLKSRRLEGRGWEWLLRSHPALHREHHSYSAAKVHLTSRLCLAKDMYAIVFIII